MTNSTDSSTQSAVPQPIKTDIRQALDDFGITELLETLSNLKMLTSMPTHST
jgi:hypothetical protein